MHIALQRLAAAVLTVGPPYLDVVLRHQSNLSSGVLRFDPATANTLKVKQSTFFFSIDIFFDYLTRSELVT